MRPRLVIFPGTMRGVHGGGQVTALEKRDRKLIHGFEGIDGASTGAAIGAYALAGQAEEGTRLYYEECTTPDFISFRRMLHGGNGADVGYLAHQFRAGPKRLKQENIYASGTELCFGVTEYETGNERYVVAKEVKPDIVHGIHVSIAMPALYREPLYIDGVRCNDGGSSCRLVRKALSHKPTGVVVFTNCSRNHHESSAKKFMTNMIMIREPKAQRVAIRNRYKAAAEDIEGLKESGVPYLILYSDGEIGSYTRDADKLKKAAQRSCDHLLSLLDRAGV